MLNTNNTDQSTGQTLNPVVDQSYDLTMRNSEELKRHDDEILEAYLEYEEYMNQENNYRSAA